MEVKLRAYRFEVSDYLFRLTTEAVRLFSNSIRKHSLLDEIVNQRAYRASALIQSYEIEDLQEHLRLIPANGDIELTLEIIYASADAVETAIPELERALGSSVRFIEVVSLILFDLVVERNSTHLVTKLGLTLREAEEYQVHLKRRTTNIVPIR